MTASAAVIPEMIARNRAARLQAAGLRVDGVPFDLAAYPYLYQYLNDDHPSIVVLKGAQLGWTIATALKKLDRLIRAADDPDVHIRSLLYLFPRDVDVSDFSKARLSRLLSDNPDIGAWVKSTDATNIKTIGEAAVYLRGAGSAAGLKSIPADEMAIDERDEMDDDMVELAYHRLDASEDPHLVEFSTPTLPGYGVSAAYDESDGQAWHLRCSHCNTWTCLEETFPDCICERPGGDAYYGCRKCHEPLTLRGDGLQAEWVARNPGREKRGYAISQLNSPRRKASTILHEFHEAERKGKFREFYNSTLGLPWAEIEDVLTREIIGQACTTYPRATADDGPCVLGVDPGVKVLHWCLLKWIGSNLARMPAYGVCREFQDLDEIQRKYKVKLTLIDEGAERRAVSAYKEGRSDVYGVMYQDRKTASSLEDWDDHASLARCDRTATLDASHKAVVDRRITFPRADEKHRELLEPQLMNLARQVRQERDTGKLTIRWVYQKTKNDHLRHALNYAWIALQRLPQVKLDVHSRSRGGTISRGPQGL